MDITRDINIPVIFVSFFIGASISLYLVYKYGTKNKSYEEVLAEQRKQTSALLGSKPTKLKEKKVNKKAAKKLNKEKAASLASITSETEVTTGTEDATVMENIKEQPGVPNKSGVKKLVHKLSKAHVEFKDEPEEVPIEVPLVEKEVKEVVNKKRSKKVKPILVKKPSDSKIAVPTVEPPSTENHFEEIHPKDEFELMRSNSREEINHKSEPTKDEKKHAKKNKQHKPAEPLQQPTEQEQTVTIEESSVILEKEKVTQISAPPILQDPVPQAGAKEKKKKKSESNSRPQLTSERDQLIRSVRNAELSRTEVQLLIDLLLNKQLEAPAVIDDWSEGKSDPIQKLKKQLADKEKQLADEQETLAGVQAKLKEVRSEQLTERVQLQQKVRAAEESKLEIVAAHNRLQQKIQELEEVRSKEVVNFQRLAEENNALQMQRSQLEATLISFQETEALIHSLKAENLHLSKQCQLLTQQRQEQDTNYQNCLLQIQSLERNHAFTITAQQEEIRKKHEQQLHRLSENHSIEEQRLKEIIIELKAEIQQLKDESNVQVNGSADETKAQEMKLLNLTNELTSVRSELSSVSQTLLEVEKRHQKELSASMEKCSALKVELDEQKTKNDELRKKNWKVMEALNAAESRIKTKPDERTDLAVSQMVTNEQNAHKQFLQRLFPDIQVVDVEPLSDWQREFESAVRKHVSSLGQKAQHDTTAEVAKLQHEVQHYKQIIDETEGILKKLESHIEEEERNWRHKLSEKDAEIQELRDLSISQLQIKVTHLENQLAQVQAEKLRLLEERQQILDRPEVKTVYSDSPLGVEKEVDHVKELLRVEQIKSSEAGIYQNGATS